MSRSQRTGFLAETTSVDLFERQVAKSPDRVAIADDANLALSYAELNRRANHAARWLVKHGAGPEQVVGIICSRSIDLVIAMLGILKSGAAYVALPPDYPAERLDRILHETRPICMLTNVKGWAMAESRKSLDTKVLDHEGSRERDAGCNLTDEDRAQPLRSQHPAYVVYTSGSSGRPKGVVGLHAGLTNRLQWAHGLTAFSEQTRVLARTSISFIDGTTELLAPLAFGGTLMLADDTSVAHVTQLSALAARHCVTRINIVPSLLSVVVGDTRAASWATCRQWVSSGEALSGEMVVRFAKWLPEGELFNLYGMSEASGDSLWQMASGKGEGPWRPLWNTQLYVLDPFVEMVPPGVKGELFVSGIGLARGYLNAPALTAERFIANPHGPPGSRMYRTGDNGWYHEDGNLELGGRTDRQVKIDGIRIEPAETENRLRQMPGIRDAVVISQATGDRVTLVAYLVKYPHTTLRVAELRTSLMRSLPSSMVPAAFVELDTLPLLPSGKVDLSALERVQMEPYDSAASVLNNDETLLCGIFRELFGDQEIHAGSEFFLLGGHSLQAIRLANRIRASTGIEIDATAVFDHPSVKALARYVATVRRERLGQ